MSGETVNPDNNEAEATSALPARPVGVIDYLEHLICPVCLELPKDTILQCSNGHSLCSDCHQENQNRCPVCRAPYGRGLIRNRFAEDLLDKMEFQCSWKEDGCKEGGFKRQQLNEHLAQCQFNANVVRLCDLLFMNNCPYQVPLGVSKQPDILVQPEDLLDHLITSHEVLIEEAFSEQEIVIGSRWRHPAGDGHGVQIVKLMENEKSPKLVGLFARVVYGFDLSGKTHLSWFYVRLTDTPQARKTMVRFSLMGSADNVAVPELSWNGEIMGALEFRRQLDMKPGEEGKKRKFGIPEFHLLEHCLNAEELLVLKVVLTTPTCDDTEKVVEESGTFMWLLFFIIGCLFILLLVLN